MSRWRALIGKELLDAMRNRAALLPVALVAVMAIALPFVAVLRVGSGPASASVVESAFESDESDAESVIVESFAESPTPLSVVDVSLYPVSAGDELSLPPHPAPTIAVAAVATNVVVTEVAHRFLCMEPPRKGKRKRKPRPARERIQGMGTITIDHSFFVDNRIW